MDRSEAISSIVDAFGKPKVRLSLVAAIRGAYRDSMERGESYGPHAIAKCHIPHDRGGLVGGRLFQLARETDGLAPVMIDNNRCSYTFFGIQSGNVLLVPARTPAKHRLPREAIFRCRLAASPQMALEGFGVLGYDANAGDPLLAILAHGQSRHVPGTLAWARIVMPDQHYKTATLVADLLADELAVAVAPEPVIEVVPVRPRLRKQTGAEEMGA